MQRKTDKIDQDALQNVVDDIVEEGDVLMATIAEQWIEQGIAQGLERGREEGLKEGREEEKKAGKPP